MNNRIVYLLASIWLINCATAGKIISNCFTDNTYPFEIEFPENYDVSAQPSKSVQRVVAIIGSDKLTQYIKPMFVVSVNSTDKSLNELKDKEKNIHFEPRYYMGTVIDYEEYIDIGVFYFSTCGTPWLRFRGHS